jgi:hypothetical protein
MAGQLRNAQLIEADFGDENGRRTITKHILSKLVGSKEINVDSSLLPLIQTEGEISLDSTEVRQAKEKATDACGGNANDTACIEKQQQQIQQQMLEEKKNTSNSTANIIKGRRLRLVVLEDGKQKVYQIPDGQIFNPEKMGLAFSDEIAGPGQKKAKAPPLFTLPSLADIIAAFFFYGGSFLLVFLYVISVLTTWQSFRKANYDIKIAAIPTAVSIVVPYSGFFITLGFFLITRYYLNVKGDQNIVIKEWR